MKDYTKEELEASRPDESAKKCVNYCLAQLFKDKTKSVSDIVAGKMTYEELVGALLLARDSL